MSALGVLYRSHPAGSIRLLSLLLSLLLLLLQVASLLVLATTAFGCASDGRWALHFDPRAVYDASGVEEGGWSVAPSLDDLNPRAPVLVLPFEDHTLTPHGSYLDDGEAKATYLIPALSSLLQERTADAITGTGTPAYRAYDTASARNADSIVGSGLNRLGVDLRHLEIHTFCFDAPVPTLDGAGYAMVVRIAYDYRIEHAEPSKRPDSTAHAQHDFVLKPDDDALQWVAQYIARDVLDLLTANDRGSP
ncbi:MAG: hypothetical protein IPK13_03690 [Deltaproteobacteria bacterium]|nr:hypothetical protein [Deltaproteobacteria bacterium]